MTDANDYRNAAQDPEFRQQVAKDQQHASPEAIARYRASFETMQRDQNQITRAIAAYEEARMGARPKFILHINGNHFQAKRSRGGLIDVVIVAIAGACWFAVLAGAWMIFG